MQPRCGLPRTRTEKWEWVCKGLFWSTFANMCWEGRRWIWVGEEWEVELGCIWQKSSTPQGAVEQAGLSFTDTHRMVCLGGAAFSGWGPFFWEGWQLRASRLHRSYWQGNPFIAPEVGSGHHITVSRSHLQRYSLGEIQIVWKLHHVVPNSWWMLSSSGCYSWIKYRHFSKWSRWCLV